MKDLKDHLRHAKKVGECIQVSDWSRYLHILYPLHILADTYLYIIVKISAVILLTL